MLNKIFASYAEYTLRTKLSEAKLRTALQRECGMDDLPFSMLEHNRGRKAGTGRVV